MTAADDNVNYFHDVIFDAMTDDYNDNPTLIKSRAVFHCQFWSIRVRKHRTRSCTL
jgi:hypothetical protein